MSLVDGIDYRTSGAGEIFARVAVEFDGRPTPGELQEFLERALALFGLEPTTRNFARAAVILVALRHVAAKRGVRALREIAVAMARPLGLDLPPEDPQGPTTRHERAQATIRPRKRR